MNIDTLQTSQHINPVARHTPLLFMLLAVLLPSAVFAQQPAAAHPPANAPSFIPTDEAKHKPDVPGSIHIHGHWKIDVRNPDGSLDRRVEFDNAFATPGQGDITLASLLTGQAVISDWAIILRSTAPLCDLGHTTCAIVQSTAYPMGAPLCGSNFCVANLTPTITVNQTTSAFSLTLSGTITAAEATRIETVSTAVGVCQGSLPSTSAAPAAYITTTPSACQASSLTAEPTGSTINTAPAFTGTAQGLSLTAGQVVQVMVNISFT